MDRRIEKAYIVVIALIIILNGIYAISIIVLPLIFFKRDNPQTIAIQKVEASPKVEAQKPIKKIPDNRLIIPVIDVNAEIGTNEKFLDFGGWIVKLHDNGMPLAIAIHRFGLDSLTNEQRIHQTLFHVDQLKVGDLLTLDWNSKEYSYKVKTINEDTNNPPIGDNELLLYTCKYWVSPVRVFVLLDSV